MQSPVRDTEAADNAIVAPFAEFSLDEFVALVAANPDIHYRFNAAGDVIQMSPTFLHADVQGAIVTHFNIWLWQGALPGYRTGVEPTYDLGDWRCQPDVAVDLRQGKVIPKQAPLVAVEVRSDSNTWPELREKARRYLEHGTQMVWLVDMDSRSLELHVADAAPQTLRGDDLIDGGAVLPGFRLPLGELFPKPTD
ncbi:MAG: Uma2 family endonuclease [Anaerolineaceae bacterium]|nr:Uma2 family endonuclease [Anaerolineaceae bacterium]